MSRRIALRIFCSIKGGVGKSTLAVTCAKLLAARGRSPVLIDANLSGTSLSDGLLLCAPKIPLRGGGKLDLDAPPTGQLYTLEETVRLRDTRRSPPYSNEALPPAYFNDALDYRGDVDDQECRADAMLWRHERDDGVLYFPSSPIGRDMEASLGWIHADEQFGWMCRVTWILDTLLERLPELTDVILDMPAGLWGLTHEALVLGSTLARRMTLPDGYPDWHPPTTLWDVRSTLVTTSDWDALLPALEYAMAHSTRMLNLRLLINRAGTESLLDLRAALRRRFAPAALDIGLDERVDHVEDLGRSLGQIFRRGDVSLDEGVRLLSPALRLEDTR